MCGGAGEKRNRSLVIYFSGFKIYYIYSGPGDVWLDWTQGWGGYDQVYYQKFDVGALDSGVLRYSLWTPYLSTEPIYLICMICCVSTCLPFLVAEFQCTQLYIIR